jgi:hypothetical protein
MLDHSPDHASQSFERALHPSWPNSHIIEMRDYPERLLVVESFSENILTTPKRALLLLGNIVCSNAFEVDFIHAHDFWEIVLLS